MPRGFQSNRPPNIYMLSNVRRTYDNVYTIVTLCVGRIVSIIGALSIYRDPAPFAFPRFSHFPKCTTLALNTANGTHANGHCLRRMHTGLGVDQLWHVCMYGYSNRLYLCG